MHKSSGILKKQTISKNLVLSFGASWDIVDENDNEKETFPRVGRTILAKQQALN